MTRRLAINYSAAQVSPRNHASGKASVFGKGLINASTFGKPLPEDFLKQGTTFIQVEVPPAYACANGQCESADDNRQWNLVRRLNKGGDGGRRPI